jgi:D-tyrosyl-tRNA(Tyr) deacylase
MRALIQRTSGATVTVDDEIVGKIGPGLVIFICAMRGDTEAESEWLARKAVKLRVFRDEDGRMNRSVQDVGGSALIVSQFTLAAETRGNRPGFSAAAAPEDGERLYEHFKAQVQEHGVSVSSGRFGAEMEVSLVNDGPVTILFDAAERCWSELCEISVSTPAARTDLSVDGRWWGRVSARRSACGS